MNTTSKSQWIRKEKVSNTVTFLLLSVGVVLFLFPFFWMISTSLRAGVMHLKAGTQEVMAVCAPEKSSPTESMATLFTGVEKIHLFDPKTEAAIA